jgi:hypothetical protein
MSFVQKKTFEDLQTTYLRLFPVFQCEYKVEIRFVIHFSAVRQALFEDSIDEGGGERARPVVEQLVFAQHAIVILVEVQILP